jgi:hypothetical protein
MLGTHRKFGGKLYLRVAWNEERYPIDVLAKEEKRDGDTVKVFKSGNFWYLYRMLKITSPSGKSYPIAKKGNLLSKFFYGGQKK